MAHGSKKHIGAGSLGKGTGAGGMSDLDTDLVGDNDVLSNRDKAARNDDRGRDGKWIESEQLQDHAANRTADARDSAGDDRGRTPSAALGAHRDKAS